jgi:hypothetical protein
MLYHFYFALFTLHELHLERARGFEPLTASLEGWNSTTELRPPLKNRPKVGVKG